MLKLFSRATTRAIPPISSYSFRQSLVRMSSGKAGNDQLTGSKLFDVSHITAVVTGGGTGAIHRDSSLKLN